MVEISSGQKDRAYVREKDYAALEARVKECERYMFMWTKLKEQLERTSTTGFKEKTGYALTMMTTIEEESEAPHD
jgi:hypothetical protein